MWTDLLNPYIHYLRKNHIGIRNDSLPMSTEYYRFRKEPFRDSIFLYCSSLTPIGSGWEQIFEVFVFNREKITLVEFVLYVFKRIFLRLKCGINIWWWRKITLSVGHLLKLLVLVEKKYTYCKSTSSPNQRLFILDKTFIIYRFSVEVLWF